MRYVPPKLLADLLMGSMYLSGTAFASVSERLERAARWYAELVGQGLEGLPFEVVFDVGSLLLEGPGAPLGVSEWFDRYPAPERALRVRYGNGFLSSLLERPWFLRAHDLVAAAEAPDAAIVFALEHLVGPLGVTREDELVLQPSRFAQLPWGRLGREAEEQGLLGTYREALERFEAWSGETGGLTRDLERFLDRAAMQSGRTLLGELEFFELKHLPRLASRERRLAARHLKQAELLLSEVDLATLGRSPEVEEVDVNLPDEGTYPSGGLGSLSTRGTWENLVPSELIYMGPPGVTDLFAVRLAENELLFYTRDGGQLRRRRRRVHLVLDRDEEMRIQFPEHPYPVDRLLEGLLARLIGDVLAAFEGDACAVAVHQRGPGAAESAELLRLRFEEEIHRGEVEVEVTETLDPLAWVERQRKNYCVWFARRPPLGAALRHELEVSRVAAYGVRLGGPAPREADPRDLTLPLDETLVPAMEELRDRLVEALVGAR